MSEFVDLVDRAVIDEAAAAFRASAIRRTAAEDDLAAKQANFDAAVKAADAALLAQASGTGTAEATAAADLAVKDAEQAHAGAVRMHDATIRAHAEITTRHHAAKGLAWTPILRLAAAESIGASRDFQVALTALADAVQRKVKAREIAHAAMAEGAKLPFDGGLLDPIPANHQWARVPAQFEKILRAPDAEAALWGDLAR